MKRIKAIGNNVEGVEISNNAIKNARKNGFTVYDCSLNDDWSKNIKKKYDVIFAGELIEHIFDTDKLLRNVRKVLKKGGEMLHKKLNITRLLMGIKRN
jgi:2-polyprenyl-3-methyl-5-hydroxy-6-metoxy-1,4-benzoquinol methylase